jgi:hypothetical protein
MAHNVIPLSSIQLVDNWPGPVNPGIGKPVNGWDGSTSCFSTTSGNITPTCSVGQKRMAYTDNSHCPGWYTMMYLSYHSFESGAVSADFSDTEFICVKSDQSTEEWYDNSFASYFVVTNEITIGNSDFTKGCRVAIPCSTMGSDGTASYGNGYGDNWGWFWVGGVCPCKDATILDGTVGSGYGAEVACSSTYEGGPLALDTSGDRLFFKEHIYGPATPNIYGIQNQPVVAYGDVSGS